MKIGIVDYGAGNIGSLERAFRKIGVKSLISMDRDDLLACDKIIVPGVGAYGYAIHQLDVTNIREIIKEVHALGSIPILGICLGMQLFGKGSEESVGCQGLSLLDFQCKALTENRKTHIGWNSVEKDHESLLLDGIDNLTDFYFVHSYAVKSISQDCISSYTNFEGERFISSIESKSLFLTQFHPEKSQKAGLKLLKNFCEV